MVKRDVPMGGSTSTSERRYPVSSRARLAWAILFATTLAVCIVPAGCAATDEQPETPAQLYEISQSSKRAIPAVIKAALLACANEGAKRLSRHAYEISFEAKATATRVLPPVEPVGNRLDDMELEACMIRALEAMPVRDLQPQDDLLPATSQRILPHARGLIGNTAVLPQVIRLAPIVISAPGGITIVVVVSIVVLVAAVLDSDDDDTNDYCQRHYEDCLMTPLADRTGSVHGETHCEWCRQDCVKHGAWPLWVVDTANNKHSCQYRGK